MASICPVCASNDASQKVPTIISQGTEATVGSAITFGEGGIRPAYYTSTSQSGLAYRLSPVRKPGSFGTGMRLLLMLGGITAATTWFYFAWVSTFLPTRYFGDVLIDLFVAFIPGGPIGLCLGLLIMLIAPLFRLRARQLWRAKTVYLSNSYYCFRDDIVYNPDLNYASPEVFIGNLYAITPRMVKADRLARAN